MSDVPDYLPEHLGGDVDERGKAQGDLFDAVRNAINAFIAKRPCTTIEIVGVLSCLMNDVWEMANEEGEGD